MNESTNKKGERPTLIGYAEWDPKKKRFRLALWDNQKENPVEAGKQE